ncbi:MAG: helix-turn-helix transcriptional regulator [Armatimonadota bacterium]
MRNAPNISFCDTSTLNADAFIVEQSLLTPTEQKVLQALAELGSIDDVSKNLRYHSSTVKRKLCRIYKKLKVKSAPQAVAVGMRLGLIK